jgi:hypothetical protein
VPRFGEPAKKTSQFRRDQRVEFNQLTLPRKTEMLLILNEL